MKNRWRLIAVLVIALFTFLVPNVATALGPDCKAAPTPENPNSGVASWFVDAPKEMPKGDSWVNGAPSFAHYGYAGYSWNTYDLGCGLGLALNPDTVIGTSIANWLYILPKLLVGLTNFAVHYAFHPTFLNVFDPLVTTAMTALKTALFDQWALLFLALAGIGILWKIRRMKVSHAATMVGWALLVFIVSAAVFQWPLRAGHAADTTVTTVLGSINSGITGATGQKGDPADQVAQNLTNAVLYEQWKTGEFGDANGATAKKYAKDMWESQTLTWADAKLIEDDPDGAGKRLLEFKKKQFEETAAKIKDEDPAAYEYLQGKKPEDRFGSAFMALFGAVVACPFLLVSSVLILIAFVLVRFAVIFFPVVATFSVSYQFRGMLKGLANVVAAAVVNCIAFGAGASVAILCIGVLLSPTSQLPIVLRLLLVCLTTVIMWSVLKPFTKLTTMVRANHNLFGQAADTLGNHTKGLKRELLSLGKSALGSAVGNAAGNKITEIMDPDHRKKKDDKHSEDTPVEEPVVEETPETPEPVVIELPPARQPVAAIGTRPAHAEPAPHERPAAQEPTPVDATPVPPAVSPRPAHREVGPYEATQTGGAVVPVVGMATPPTAPDQSSNPARPEYTGVTPVFDGTSTKTGGQDHGGVWRPGEPDITSDESTGLVDLRGGNAPVVDATGAPVWPVWTPDQGVTFDGDRSAPAAEISEAPAEKGRES